jgi:hypothetical protein
VIPGTEGLGEQALNKIAEMALSTQLEQAERLSVQVKTDPSKLAQGELESLTIDGEGLVMQKDLRMQEMEIKMNSIAVSPLKALLGNIELTKPTQGTARIVLTEADINRAFNSQTLGARTRNLNIDIDGKLLTVNTQHVDCKLLADDKIAIAAEIQVQQTGEIQQVSFSARPCISPSGQGVFLGDVQYTPGKELYPALTKVLVEQASHILNLSDFAIEGIVLGVHQLNVAAGTIILHATAQIQKFPST